MNKPLVIIGAGITGLSAGIAWAKNVDIKENPVIILEKNRIPGGCVNSFRRNGYLFDTAQIIPDIRDILEYFGIEIELVKFEGNYAKIFIAGQGDGLKEYTIPSGIRNFEDYLVKTFPGEEKAVRRFVGYSEKMYGELYRLKVEPNFIQLLGIIFRCPKIIANSGKTFKEYLQRFGFARPEIIEYFNQFAAFSALPSERCAALLAVGAMFTSLTGAYRTKSGFIEFPVKMAKRFRELGGIVNYNSEVKKIIVKEGRAEGVLLESGEFIETSQIISTADPKVLAGKLIGFDTLQELDPEYSRKVSQVKMSPSSLHISLGLDDKIDMKRFNLSTGYNILSSGGNVNLKLYEMFDRNQVEYDETLFRCGVICPTLTTGGRNILTIRAVPVAPAFWNELREKDYDNYTIKKNEAAGYFIGLVEKYLIPGLSNHIVTIDVATPATFSRYIGSPTGSNYDMSPCVDNFGKTRLKMRTPAKGLYQPKFSHGIWPCMQAGLQAVDMILGGKIMNGNSRFGNK